MILGAGILKSRGAAIGSDWRGRTFISDYLTDSLFDSVSSSMSRYRRRPSCDY